MDSSRPPALMLQAEKALPQPIRPHLLAYCPTMDLLAVVTEEENLDVYRLNGQRAFGRKRKDSDTRIDGICWKFNGQYVAVAWDDGEVEVVSAETGKIVPHGFKDGIGAASAVGDEEKKVSCLGWGVNFIDVAAVKARIGGPERSNQDGSPSAAAPIDSWDTFKEEVTLDDFLQRQPDLQTLDVRPDLPDQLALMDIETILPKLPVIPNPPTGMIMARRTVPIPAVFRSQASIDALLHSHHLKDPNAADILIVCFDDGTIQPTIYDSLTISGLRIPTEWKLKRCRPILHVSHPYISSHNLLMETCSEEEDDSTSRLALVPLTFQFISAAGIYLHLISSKTAQLQNLLRYSEACLQCISMHWYFSQDLPSRLLKFVGSDLSDADQGTILDNLYHLAVTGHCPARVKEWLTDELTENGHKRWDTAITQGYNSALTLVHENLLPALDRCSIIISTLRGLVTYHDSDWIFSVPAADFTAILDTIRTFRLLAHNILLHGGEERRQFLAFSKWLRREIGNQASSEPLDEEALDREGQVDYPRLLAYIQGGLLGPKLTNFIELNCKPGERSRIHSVREDDTEIDPFTYEYESVRKTCDAIRLGEKIENVEREQVSTWNVMTQLQEQCAELIDRIAKWQKRSCGVYSGLVIEDEKAVSSDMRMVFETSNSSDEVTCYIALVPQSTKDEIRIHRIVQSSTGSDVSSSIRSFETSTIKLSSDNGTVVDVKFADDDAFLALYKTRDTTYLLRFPYRPLHATSESASPTPLNYASRNPSTTQTGVIAPHSGLPPPPPSIQLASPASLAPHTRHIFNHSDRFVPIRLEINGRRERRVLVLLNEGGRAYRVYDLDWDEKVAMEEGDTSLMMMETDQTMTG